MRMDRLTTKSQEALRAALDLASRRGNPEIIPEHLLVSILNQDGGVGAPLVERAGASPQKLSNELGARLEGLPKVSGGAEPSFGRRLTPLLNQAEEEAKRFKDDYVSVEHFLLAAAKHDKDVQAIFDRQRPLVRQARARARGDPRQPARHRPGSRGQVPGAREVHARSDRRRQARQGRPRSSGATRRSGA